MNLSILDQSLITLVLLGLNALVFIALIIIYSKIRKISRDSGRLVTHEEKLRKELRHKIEEIAVDTISQIGKDSSARVEAEVKKLIDDMASLAHVKSKEIGEFVKKAEEDQVRESQYFVANMLNRVQKDVDLYRENKIKKVDEQIRQIVISAAREVIGRAISLSEHEDLVNKALEKAKKDQLFV